MTNEEQQRIYAANRKRNRRGYSEGDPEAIGRLLFWFGFFLILAIALNGAR